MSEGLATWIMALAAVAVLVIGLLVLEGVSIELKSIAIFFFIFACYVIRVELQLKEIRNKKED